MIKPKTEKKCSNLSCDKTFKPRKTFDKYCSYDCYKSCEKAPSKPKRQRIVKRTVTKIRKVSKKQSVLIRKYDKNRLEFLSKPENHRCAVYNHLRADQVHHKMGRVGYADEWGRQNDIPLLIDVRFFLAVSHPGHREIEDRPDWAKERGFSMNRLKNYDA